MPSKLSQENKLRRIKIIGTKLASQSIGDRKAIGEISKNTGISKPYLYQVRDGRKEKLSDAFLKILEEYFGISETPADTPRGGEIKGKEENEALDVDILGNMAKIVLEKTESRHSKALAENIISFFQAIRDEDDLKKLKAKLHAEELHHPQKKGVEEEDHLPKTGESEA